MPLTTSLRFGDPILDALSPRTRPIVSTTIRPTPTPLHTHASHVAELGAPRGPRGPSWNFPLLAPMRMTEAQQLEVVHMLFRPKRSISSASLRDFSL